MARIRTIKPEFFTSESVCAVSPLARLLFVGLWCEADREGRMTWKPRTYKIRYLPVDQADIEELSSELIAEDMIRLYEIEGEVFCFIPGFTRHQVINNRETKSALPEFDENSRVHHASTRVKAEGRKEGKGKERKGKERKEHKTLVQTPPEPKPDSVLSQVTEIFHFWCDTMKKNRAQNKITPKRDKAIRARLKEGYTVEDIKLAITGCSKDAFSMGQNDRGKPFNDIELICRTGEKLEGFRDHQPLSFEERQQEELLDTSWCNSSSGQQKPLTEKEINPLELPATELADEDTTWGGRK